MNFLCFFRLYFLSVSMRWLQKTFNKKIPSPYTPPHPGLLTCSLCPCLSPSRLFCVVLGGLGVLSLVSWHECGPITQTFGCPATRWVDADLTAPPSWTPWFVSFPVFPVPGRLLASFLALGYGQRG